MNYKISAKYIKSLNFEIPNPKAFLTLVKNISNYKINIDIKSNQIKEKIIEIQTTLNLTPIKQDLEIIETKITFATIIELSEGIINKKDIEEIILIKVPSEIYPELRKIFIFVFENSGFKEVKINENVDFKKLYDLRKIQ